MSDKYIKNPKTGRKIKYLGKTYLELAKDPYWSSQLSKSSKKSSKKKGTSKKQGSSNRNKYPDVSKSDFCGPEGGSSQGTYPVNTRGRARAALAYSRHAPNPQGIRECVYRKSKQKGWIDKEGRLTMS